MTDHPGIPPQEGVMIERQWESLAQFGPSLPEKAESEQWSETARLGSVLSEFYQNLVSVINLTSF